MNWRELRTFLRFCSVGLVNTALTLSIVFVLFRFGRLDLVSANAIGYLAGICFSFFVNRAWTFSARGQAVASGAARFLLVTAVAYVASLGALTLAYSVAGLGPVWSQAIGLVVYTALGFCGSRLFAFRAR